MGQMLGDTPTAHQHHPRGAVSPSRKRDQEAARSNRRASPVSVRVTSQWCAQEAADQAVTKPRVHDGLLVANMVERKTIMKVCSMWPCAACGR